MRIPFDPKRPLYMRQYAVVGGIEPRLGELLPDGVTHTHELWLSRIVDHLASGDIDTALPGAEPLPVASPKPTEE